MDVKLATSSLTQGGDGIWYGPEEDSVSYPSEGYDRCFAVEERSFWFQHRNRCIVAAVKRLPPLGRGPILDIGGGNGFVSRGLADAGFEVALLEPGRAGAVNAKSRGVATVICATFTGAEFQPGSLPACGLFDVLEHIEDDESFLRSVEAVLAPDGLLYLTVPSYPFLWSHQDELAGHYRRYTRRSLTAALALAGLEVELATYFFRPLPAAILLLRAIPYRLGLARDRIETDGLRRTHAVSQGLASRLLALALESEVVRIRRTTPMRFGGSCLVVARKRSRAEK